MQYKTYLLQTKFQIKGRIDFLLQVYFSADRYKVLKFIKLELIFISSDQRFDLSFCFN